MSKHTVGKVLELYVTLEKDHSRVQKETIVLDADGVLEDKFHAKDIHRSVLLTSKESYAIAEKNSIDIARGENILIDYNPYHLLAGDHITIGEVLLEVTQNCTLCKGLSSVNPKLPKLLKDDRGIFVKVIHSGSINIGDTVQVDND
jgi:MOSC domain-containing protein YiiM